MFLLLQSAVSTSPAAPEESTPGPRQMPDKEADDSAAEPEEANKESKGLSEIGTFLKMSQRCAWTMAR